MERLFAGIEGGGTKFVCAVGSGQGNIFEHSNFRTTTPEETLQKTIQFLNRAEGKYGSLDAIGVASFGPLDPDPSSTTFGRITSTPKPGWAGFDIVDTLRKDFDLPIGFDTDVNGAALGEWRWGAAQGLDTFIYLTVGTGIGGGGMTNGKLMHGLIHPEMGHIRIPHDWEVDNFPGVCPYHGDCLEGLANGPAIEARWGQRAEIIPFEHPAWALEARYLALGLMNFICTLSPQQIIMGGGVMKQMQIFPLIRKEVVGLLNGYLQSPQILGESNEFIVPPALGMQAGVMGAIALAEMASNASFPL